MNVAKKIADVVTGGSISAAAKQQRLQQRAIADQKAKQDAVEAGQRRAASGGGFLAYVDDQLKDLLG
jgi:hypothetical protein